MWIEAQSWSEATFGQVALGDPRRTARAVQMGAALLRRPQASLPQQFKHWAALKAAYRWLDDDQIPYEALLTPHWQQTRHAASGQTVLLIQDTTDLDYSGQSVEGLGPIGDGRGYGFRLHSALAVRPEPREVLGLLAQQPFLRQARGTKHESSYQRSKRERESQRWEAMVQTIGSVPDGSQWIYVCDREGDIFSFYRACQETGSDFVVRMQTDRRVQVEADSETEEITHLITVAQSWAAQFEKVVTTQRKAGGQREAQVAVSWGALSVQAPLHSPQQAAVPIWVVRAWETRVPPEGEAAVEWVLLTSLPVTSETEAAQVLQYYALRWLIEDYHQCLKTGCQIEQRRLREQARLWRLLGLLAVVAVQLLQWREWARSASAQLARTQVPNDWVRVVAHLAERPAEQLTLGEFWLTLARQGGYLARRRDGPPGWKTIWRGWQEIETLVRGFRLASTPYD
jgi:hypothetical protein